MRWRSTRRWPRLKPQPKRGAMEAVEAMEAMEAMEDLKTKAYRYLKDIEHGSDEAQAL